MRKIHDNFLLSYIGPKTEYFDQKTFLFLIDDIVVQQFYMENKNPNSTENGCFSDGMFLGCNRIFITDPLFSFFACQMHFRIFLEFNSRILHLV